MLVTRHASTRAYQYVAPLFRSHSATMPAKIKAFAESALVDPVEVNVGRAGEGHSRVGEPW